MNRNNPALHESYSSAEDLVEKLTQFMENGGSLIVSSDVDSTVNM